MKENHNQNENQNQSKQILLSVLAVAILVVAVVGVSFAAFTYTGTGEKVNTVSTGTIEMKYTEPTNGITINDAMPVDENVGKIIPASGTSDAGTIVNGVFDFTVRATISGTTTINYEVSARKDTTTYENGDGTDVAKQLDDQYIRLYLEKDTTGGTNYNTASPAFAPAQYTALTEATAVGTPVGNMVLDSGSFSGTGGTIGYRLRMWVDSSFNLGTDPGAKYGYKVYVDVYANAA